MGQRGPAPTPTKLLKLRGSWRANKRQAEVKAETGKPYAPNFIAHGDGKASACWKYCIRHLDSLGLTQKIDRNMLARYCEIWSQWREMSEYLKRHGWTYPKLDGEGKPIGVAAWPQVGIMMKLSDQMLRIEQQFGMSPSARARLASEIEQAAESTASEDGVSLEDFKLG